MKKGSERPQPPTGAKLWSLRAFGILFAFFLLGIVEVSLRVLGVAAPEPLVLRKQQGAFDAYQLNPRVGLNYFPSEMERIMPQPGFQLFRAEKPAGTLRIFVLGGSTTAGFPYTAQGAFANFLRIRLEEQMPGTKLEVVNCGITALNSYAVLDFVKELRHHSPDLFLVYAGHNEFYGALGPASRVAFGKSRFWVDTIRSIMDLRISRLLSQAVQKAKGEQGAVEGQTLMGAMVGKTGIRESDPIFTATLEGYESNLRGIADAAGDTPVLFCEVVSNLRDQYPFQSLCGTDRSDAECEQFGESAEMLDRELRAAFSQRERASVEETDQGEEDVSPLLERAESLVREQPDHAGAVYTHAEAALLMWLGQPSPTGLGDASEPSAAKAAPAAILEQFTRARDLDAIRFRAPSQINQAIRSVVEGERASSGGAAPIGLVPTESWIDARSSFGIPGNDVFVEHLHLNLFGADEVARAIVHTLRESGWFTRQFDEAGGELPDPTFEFVMEKAGLTPLDHEIADRRAFHLVHRWPYPEDRSATFRSARPRIVQQLAQSFIDHEVDLAEAHFRLGEAWFREGRREDALRELVVACEVFPVVPQRFLLAGRLALESGQTDLARSLFERGAALDPSDADLANWLERSRQSGG